MIRAVLDANIYASALIESRGPSNRILRLLLEQRAFELVLSPSLLEEARRCTTYPRVRKRIRATDAEVDAFFASVVLLAELVRDDPTLHVVENDPEDDKVVAAAVQGRASYIVTGDRHLLDLPSIKGLEVVKPAAFLGILNADQHSV